MRTLLAFVVVSSAILCAAGALAADDAAERPEGSKEDSALGGRSYSPADSLHFEQTYFRPRDEKLEGLFGIPLRQELKDNLSVGVTEKGVNWKLNW